MIDKILYELIGSIAELREQKDLLSEKLTKLSYRLETQSKTTDTYTLNIKEVQDRYTRDYEAIQKQLLEVTNIIDSKSKEYVNQLDIIDEIKQSVSNFLASIPIPRDGKDATIDYKKVNDVIVSEVSKIKPKEVDYDIVFKKIEGLISEIPKPKDGKDAVVDYTEVNKNIKEQLSNQKLVKDVIYTTNDNRFEIWYTNGDKKKISPKEAPIYLSGGASGGISYYTNKNLVPNKVGGIDAGTTFDNVVITKVLDMLLYPFEITLSINPTQAQFGQVISSIMLQFNTNGAENANIDGIDVTGLSELIYTEDVTNDKTFTLTAEKDKQIKTKTASIKFLNNIYWGATPNPTPTNAEILASKKQLSNSKGRSIIYDCSGGQRYFIAYPKRLGTVTLTVNGFPNNNFTQIERSFENEFGYIEDYFICYGNTIVFGSDIPATWS